MYYRVIKETSDYMLVWKPANLPSTPTKANPECLITYLVNDYPNLKEVEGYGKPGEYGLLNRLDNKTSGLIIIAKSDNSFLKLRIKFNSTKKIYLAFCYNLGSEKQGTITIPIAHHRTDPKRMVWVSENTTQQKFKYRGQPQKCETEFIVINEEKAKEIWSSYLPSEINFPENLLHKEEKGKYTWIKCIITKGKRHQIRIHLKYAKYPVLGDEIYSSKDEKNPKLDYYGLFGVGIEGLD